MDLELLAGLDNDREDADSVLTILTASKDGNAIRARENKLNQVPLGPGWNLIEVNFDSNQKHSLKIRSYEV